MQTYNNFNELASAQTASPLVSDMSVFNAINTPVIKRVTAELDGAILRLKEVLHIFAEHDTADKDGYGEYDKIGEMVLQSLQNVDKARTAFTHQATSTLMTEWKDDE